MVVLLSGRDNDPDSNASIGVLLDLLQAFPASDGSLGRKRGRKDSPHPTTKDLMERDKVAPELRGR